MRIIIDLGGNDDVVERGDDETVFMDEERKKREDYLKWVKYHEEVMPQVVPVTSKSVR